MAHYKLSTELHGHSKDVRGLCETYFPTANTIVSCSRDETVRIWQQEERGRCYNEMYQLRGHTGFVTSVASFRPNAQFPDGVIFSGGQDHKINAFVTSQSSEPLFTLSGHNGAVCALVVDDERQILVSGSWDATARIWMGEKCLSVLAGHSFTVWAVAVLPSVEVAGDVAGVSIRILTGSADKKIILWEGEKQQHVFEGHTDCVRALAVLSDSEFLSASNDSTIRRWNLFTGECLKVYQGHENFIYSMSIEPNSKELFVTSSEDGTAKIWNLSTGENVQTLLLPTQTIWAIRVLTNGDVVTGSSDGVVRIFSCDEKRQADPDVLAAYDYSVQSFLNTVHSKTELGGVKIADLPGPEALHEPGMRDGQTKMVRKEQQVELYKWTAASGEWEKVGDVMGAAPPSEGKTMYEGKEYDYVFEVDVEDGHPPLKLPYNVSEDPWVAANRFLEHNMLPSSYIDQVVQFIRTNAPTAGQGAPVAAFSDPFTGSSRYQPAASASPMETMSDPFTGGGRYVPGQANGTASAAVTGSLPPADSKTIDPRRPRGDNMPLNEYVTFTSVSSDSLLAKLIEFNQKQTDPNLRLTDDQILLLEEFTSQSIAGSRNVRTTEAHVKALERALKWHKDHLVPVVDLLRLAVLNKLVNDHFFSGTKARPGLQMVDFLCRLISPSASMPQFQILVPRAFTNALACGDAGRRLLIGPDCSAAVIPLIVNCLDSAKSSAQVAAATALANFSCAYLADTVTGPQKSMNSSKLDSFRLFVEKLKTVRNGSDYGSLDQEALFRILQALVTFMWGDDTIMAVGRTMKLANLISRLKDATGEERSKAIARSIERMLSI